MFGKYDMLYTVSDGSYTVRVLFQRSIQYYCERNTWQKINMHIISFYYAYL